MTRSAVTRFRDGVPVEVAAVCSCSALDGARWFYGTGSSLPECSADLAANFNAHVEAS